MHVKYNSTQNYSTHTKWWHSDGVKCNDGSNSFDGSIYALSSTYFSLFDIDSSHSP